MMVQQETVQEGRQKKIEVKTIAKRIGEKITFKKASIVGSVTTVV